MNTRSIKTFSLLLVMMMVMHAGALSQVTAVDSGWARNSINTAVFRKNSLVTCRGMQFIAFYDKSGYVMIGKRKTGAKKWELKRTAYRGNTRDAHNTISIIADGEGYLHIAWDHHNNRLNYCRSREPYSLELTDRMPMTGEHEQSVSYPEFYTMASGDLLFLYRDGGSGRGNLVINSYNSKTKKWIQLHDNLIDGEGKRNAYWQAFIDSRGTIHVSWVWRETPDVASNHDMCYARSADGGRTWTWSTGKKYRLPIIASAAEYACTIPQKTELINQTSMFADAAGNPFIVSYWREEGSMVPQYHVIYKKDNVWKTVNTGFRRTAFTLAGTGTRRIPVSRPQVISWNNGQKKSVAVIFRDAERDNKVSIAVSDDIEKNRWILKDIHYEDMGSWEPSYDTELWKQKKVLNLFIQKTEQADAEGLTDMPPTMVRVLEWKPARSGKRAP